MWFVALSLALIALALLELFYARSMKSFKDKLPGPRPFPIIGNALMALGDSRKFVQTTTDLLAKYGDRLRVYLVFDLFLLFTNPKDVEIILSSTELIAKAEVYQYLHPWLGQGLLTAAGNRWRTHRKFLTPAFHFNILQNFMPIFNRNERILVSKLRPLADGRPVNVFPLVALAALDNITESAMGVSINAQLDSESDYVKAVKEISEITWKRMRDPIWRVEALFRLLPARRRRDRALQVLHGFSLQVIRNRRVALHTSGVTLEDLQSEIGIKKRIAFLDLLLLSTLDGNHLSDDVIREEVDTFMFEGHDTTTSAISFALYCISLHEQVQETLYEEQQSIFGEDKDRTITNSDLARMSYLELVIKEALRLYPPVPFIGRHVAEDINLLGLKLPKGASVTISMLHMQRDPAVFADPLRFRPERFLPENTILRSPYSWVTFSAGPRNCIGQKFAMMEMKVVLSSVLRNFRLEASGIEPQLLADLILRSKNGVFVKFLQR